MNNDISDLETTDDALLGGKVRFRQPKSGYRAAIDPVFLAATMSPKRGHKVLDLGCGAGAAMLCLAVRFDGVEIDGLELQAPLAGLAQHNIAANGFENRLRAFEGDVLDAPKDLELESYDWVMANPPFMPDDRGNAPPDASKRAAHVEGDADLEAWIEAGEKYLKRKGTLALILRADRLSELLAALEGGSYVGEGGFGDIRILPLRPHAGKIAGRVLVHARKGVKQPSTLLAGHVLHGPDGAYTCESQVILQGAALSLEG